MARTEITRPKYRRNGLRYASDTRDEEWAVIAPHLPLDIRLGHSETQRGRINNPRRLPTRGSGSLIKEAYLVPPAIPARLCLAGEQFKIGASYQPLYPLPYFIGLAAMFTATPHHEPPYIFRLTRRFAARCQ